MPLPSHRMQLQVTLIVSSTASSTDKIQPRQIT